MSEPNGFQQMADKFEGGITICNVRFSKSVDQLIPALVKARRNFPEIHKDAEAKVYYKNDPNKSFSFRYATLPAILSAVDPALLESGIWLTQHSRPTQNQLITTTILMHESGQYMASEYAVPIKASDTKEVGIATTYCRRYSICGILGIAADEDTDAASSYPGAEYSHKQSAKQETNQKSNRTQTKPVPAESHEENKQKLKDMLREVGVEAGDKDTADAVLNYIASQPQNVGCAVNWHMAATQPGPCEKSLAALSEAHKAFPRDCETPLISIVREHQSQGPKATA